MTQLAALPADALAVARGATVAPDYLQMQGEMRQHLLQLLPKESQKQVTNV